MSADFPSIPLPATEAQDIAQAASLAALGPATQLWLADANVAITAAAKAGLFQVTLAYDYSVVNREAIIKELVVRLGYTILETGTSPMTVQWSGSSRLKVTPESTPNGLYGYKAN